MWNRFQVQEQVTEYLVWYCTYAKFVLIGLGMIVKSVLMVCTDY